VAGSEEDRQDPIQMGENPEAQAFGLKRSAARLVADFDLSMVFSLWFSRYEEPIELQSYIKPPSCFVCSFKKWKRCEVCSAHLTANSISFDAAKQD